MRTIESLDSLDRDIDDHLRVALRDAGAVFADVHGSRATESHRPESDVDVAAWFGRRVAPREVILPAGVDRLVLDNAVLELAGRDATRGVLVVDPVRLARLLLRMGEQLSFLRQRTRRRSRTALSTSCFVNRAQGAR